MDFTKTIINRLHELFPDMKIYSESNEQEHQEAYLTVMQTASSIQRYSAIRFLLSQSYNIQFFPVGERPLEQCREMADTLMMQMETLSECRGSNLHCEIKEGVLNCFVTYNRFFIKSKDDTCMQTLVQDINMKGEN